MANEYTVHGVLAGAYKGKDISGRTLLTHASTDGGVTAMCRKVKADSLCDLEETGLPTCPVCQARIVRALERAYAKALRIEVAAVDALPEGATQAQTDRCWALAAVTNAAMKALTAAHDAIDAAASMAVAA